MGQRARDKKTASRPHWDTLTPDEKFKRDVAKVVAWAKDETTARLCPVPYTGRATKAARVVLLYEHFGIYDVLEVTA